MKTFLIGAALTTCLVGHALATQQPNPGNADSRVRNVNYDPANVVELWSTPGAVMVIQFADDKMVGDVAASDSHSLKAEPRANYLFFKFEGCLIPEPVIVLTKLPSGKLRRYALQVETHPQICSNSTSPPIVQASAKADPPPVAAQNLKHIQLTLSDPMQTSILPRCFFWSEPGCSARSRIRFGNGGSTPFGIQTTEWCERGSK